MKLRWYAVHPCLSGSLHWALYHHIFHCLIFMAVYHYIEWMSQCVLNQSPYTGHWKVLSDVEIRNSPLSFLLRINSWKWHGWVKGCRFGSYCQIVFSAFHDSVYQCPSTSPYTYHQWVVVSFWLFYFKCNRPCSIQGNSSAPREPTDTQKTALLKWLRKQMT